MNAVESKMKCVFCNAEFTPKMRYDYDMGYEYDTFGNESSNIEMLEIEVKCDNCSKVCYKKEAIY